MRKNERQAKPQREVMNGSASRCRAKSLRKPRTAASDAMANFEYFQRDESFVYPQDIPEQIAYACRILVNLGMADAIWGHISMRQPGDDAFWMKPATFGFEDVMPGNMIRLTFDGKILTGTSPRHMEFPLHAEIFRARADVTAVLHAHPVHSIAFSATGQRLLPVTHEGVLFCDPDIRCFDKTSDLIDTRELGEAVALYLGNHRAMFLRNHGIVAVGGNIMETVATAFFLERAAQAQLLAGRIGEFEATSGEEIKRKRNKIFSKSQMECWWKFHCRQVGPLTAR